MKYEVIETDDGSKTLYLPEIDEQYHSVNGAISESEYVFVDKGYRYHHSKTPLVLEVGFGTGLNCLLTAIEAKKHRRKTFYYTIEKYPLDYNLVWDLNYGKNISKEADLLFNKIHKAPWNKIETISDYFDLIKLKSDFLTHDIKELLFDVVYYDAFAPNKQPEMWQPEIFRKINSICSSKAVFVTYSAKGEVRRNLVSAGFTMERLPGPPGKRQMLRGFKTI